MSDVEPNFTEGEKRFIHRVKSVPPRFHARRMAGPLFLALGAIALGVYQHSFVVLFIGAMILVWDKIHTVKRMRWGMRMLQSILSKYEGGTKTESVSMPPEVTGDIEEL